LLSYDAETGLFNWRVKRGNKAVGSDAGSLHKWGYVVISIDRKRHKAHRLAWLHAHGRWPTAQIDHINCKRADNRLSNLREATATQNQGNSPRNKNNTSGLKGVTFAWARNRWQAQISARGHTLFLGYFDDPEDAHAAYCRAARKHFGEFARIE
jgi:hypothetical protein